MVLATWIGTAWAAPGCGAPAADAEGWAAVGTCLEREARPEAAIEAWRRAFEADPTVGGLLPAVIGLSHQTGDDALLVEVARVVPSDQLSDDVRGHLALADGHPNDVGPGSCVFPLARYRQAADLIHQQKLQSAVVAYNDVLAAPVSGPDAWDDALDQLRDAALLGAASVYLGLESDGGQQFSQIVMAGAFPDLRGYSRAFGTWKVEGGVVRLRVERDTFVPEAAVLAGDTELERWRILAQGLMGFLGTRGLPATVNRTALEPSVAADVGRVWSVAVLEAVLEDVEAERRSARDPQVQVLLDARAADVAERLGAATVAAVRARLARIDAALVLAERIRDGVDGVSPVVWSTTDYGD